MPPSLRRRASSPLAAVALLLLALEFPQTGAPPAAHATGPTVSAATRNQIAARYTRYDRLDAGRDVQAVLVWYLENTTGDYVERHHGGRTVRRADVIASARAAAQLRARAQGSGIRLRSTTALRRITRRGEGASLAVVAETALSVVGTVPAAPGRKPSTVKTVETHRDTWVRAGGGWRIKRRDVLTRSSTVNGKPLTSPANAARPRR